MREDQESVGEGDQTPSRRQFLGMGAGAVAATALLGNEVHAQKPARRADLTAVTDRLGQRVEWRSVDLRLLRRITLGATAADAARIASLGFTRYLEEQLNPATIDDSACDARISTRYPPVLLQPGDPALQGLNLLEQRGGSGTAGDHRAGLFFGAAA